MGSARASFPLRLNSVLAAITPQLPENDSNSSNVVGSSLSPPPAHRSLPYHCDRPNRLTNDNSAVHPIGRVPKAVGHPPSERVGVAGTRTRGLVRLLTRQEGGARGHGPALAHPDRHLGVPVDASGDKAPLLRPCGLHAVCDKLVCSCFALLAIRLVCGGWDHE